MKPTQGVYRVGLKGDKDQLISSSNTSEKSYGTAVPERIKRTKNYEEELRTMEQETEFCRIIKHLSRQQDGLLDYKDEIKHLP
ncbi:hypothetical protein TNCV_951781 [Trichonephila clavipes]|nr:hypothetical protein TNCV_951781 [Trichonephila clavipes]